jgi:LysR family transcriptional regulator, glycine cleavage system transcriptional activator
MQKLPPLIELRAFEAAARCRSFKVAAAELGVTPTAVSHQIKLLEAYCGRPLFRRQPRPITLTWAGEQLFPVVRDGFGSFAEAINVVRTGGAAARLRLTTTNAFAARWLLPRLPQWRKTHGRLKLEIASTDEVINLENGEADISIRYVRSVPTDGPSFELMRELPRSRRAEASGKTKKTTEAGRAYQISSNRGGMAFKRCGSPHMEAMGSGSSKVTSARAGPFQPCKLELS